MRVFIGGVMQASNLGKELLDQSYRRTIAATLRARWPDVEIIDPQLLHPNSPDYDDEAARDTLFAMAELAAGADVIVAYLPSASMGTALEMYLAYQQGVPVLTISPLAENWVVRVLSTRVFPDLDTFLAYVEHCEELIEETWGFRVSRKGPRAAG
jgi:hypothetical protein